MKDEESKTPALKPINDNPVAKVMQPNKAPDYYLDISNKHWGIKKYNLGHGDYCWTCPTLTQDLVFDTEEDIIAYLKALPPSD